MNNLNAKKAVSSKNGKIKIIIAVLLAILVILNLGIHFIPDRFKKIDLTTNDAYTLSDSSRDFLEALDEEVTLYVLDADGSDTRYEYLLDIMDGYKNIDVKWLSSDKATHLLEPLGIAINEDEEAPYLVIIESEKRSSYLEYYTLLSYVNSNSEVMSFIDYIESVDPEGYNYADKNSAGYAEMDVEQYGNLMSAVAYLVQNDSENSSTYAEFYSELLYNTDRYFYGEIALCNKIEYATVDVIPTRYALTGHGETSMSETVLGALLNQLRVAYKDIDTTASLSIPEDAVSITVNAPTSDISEDEADMFIEYVENGGQMIFLTADEALAMPNLMSVINAYGMSAEAGTVGTLAEVKKETEESDESESSDAMVGPEAPSDESAEVEYEHTDTVDVYINTGHEAMVALKDIEVTPRITEGNNIVLENKEGITTNALLTTSDDCYIGDNADAKDEMILAAIAEQDNGGKLLWFTGAESIVEKITSETTAEHFSLLTNNCLPVFSSLLGLAPRTYESVLDNLSPRLYSSEYMNVTETGFIWFVIIPVAAVAIASIAGLILWYKRKKA